MNLDDLVFLLAKGNLKKYGLFIGCNVMTIAILLSLRMLLDNPILNNPSIVDPMISSNVFAPTVFVYLFILFFIPFTLFILNKQIQKNYGIMMSFGLTGKQFRKCILLENMIIITFSIVLGFIVGNIFELILVKAIENILGINKMVVYQNVRFYIEMTLFLLSIYGVSLLVVIIITMRRNVIAMITFSRESQQKKGKMGWLVAGIILFFAAMALSYLFYIKTGGNSLLIGMLISYIAIGIMVFNSEIILTKWKKHNMVLYSDYLYYFKRNRNITLILIALFSFILFLNITSGVTDRNLKENVDAYNPYDFVYSEYSSENPIDMKKPAGQCGTDIVYESHISYFYTKSYAVFGVDDVNWETGTNYHIPKGKFIFIRSIVQNDGYFHESGYVPEQMEIEGQSFKYDKDDDRLLFCRGAGLTDALILLNQEDFNEILLRRPIIENKLKLYRFEDWKKLGQLSIFFNGKNHVDVSSKYEDYLRAMQSSKLLSMLIIYISLSFFSSIMITVHYKMMSEKESDYYKYRLLQSIGAQHRKIMKYKLDKLFSVVLAPLIIAVIWMFVVMYISTFSYHCQFVAFTVWGIVSIVVTGLVLGLCLGYVRKL